MVLAFQLSLKVCLPGLLNLLASSSGSSFIYTADKIVTLSAKSSLVLRIRGTRLVFRRELHKLKNKSA